MPARKSDDPLIPLPVRFPSSFVAELRDRARRADVTLSDMLRSHLAADAVKPLGKPVPRRRPPPLAPAGRVDPALLRQLAGIGANLNQLAHQVNAASLSGDPFLSVQLLTELHQMETHLRALAVHAAS